MTLEYFPDPDWAPSIEGGEAERLFRSLPGVGDDWSFARAADPARVAAFQAGGDR